MRGYVLVRIVRLDAKGNCVPVQRGALRTRAKAERGTEIQRAFPVSGARDVEPNILGISAKSKCQRHRADVQITDAERIPANRHVRIHGHVTGCGVRLKTKQPLQGAVLGSEEKRVFARIPLETAKA